MFGGAGEVMFELEKFESFCRHMRIDSKESGRIPLAWIGTQRYAMEEIFRGLNQDIHTFVILKGRQLGISTVTLAFDLYLLFKFKGMQGGVITDSDDNRELFRSHIKGYWESLPIGMRPKMLTNNRTMSTFANASRLMYVVAGKNKNGGLGRAKSLIFAHMTEVSSWGDEEGFASLMNAFAQVNPHRFFLAESTARGYDIFYNTWEVAKRSKTQMAIFVGWWRNEFYQKSRDSKEFRAFWDGKPTSDERLWCKEVYQRYRYEVRPEQLAWWRWYVEEHMKGDELMALQEMPPTEDYAFQLSGSKFFSGERLNISFQAAKVKPCMYFRYSFGMNFEDTEFLETTDDMAEVTVWAWPNQRGVYVLGADSAFGFSEEGDEFAVSVCRCYADRVEQVLEVGTNAWNDQQFAWVISHLAGFFSSPESSCLLILEINGPGLTVLSELQSLQRQVGVMGMNDPRSKALDVATNIRHYVWQRRDSFSAGGALQWKSNVQEKIRMMSLLRANFERGVVEVSSPTCLEQFRHIRRDGDSIKGEGRAHDDRVIALGIAVLGWSDSIQIEMASNNRTYAIESRPEEEARMNTPLESSVMRFLEREGIQWRKQ